VIQFALLFGLGFLTAVFLVFLVAPAIHRRIVWFTEKRLRATMPLSAREVRAQKDMARALYAAENARTEQALTREREKTVSLQLQQETFTREVARLAVENSQLHAQIDEMSVEAGDLRSQARRKEGDISQLKASLRISEQAHAEKETDLDGFRKRIDKMVADADGLKIDLAARDAEIENLRARYNSLRNERDGLRSEMEALARRASEAEIRVDQQEHKARRLEDRLGTEIASVADKQSLIERRLQEVVRLKEKQKSGQSGRAPRSALSARIAAAKGDSDVKSTTPPTPAPPRDVDGDIARMSEEARSRSIELSDRLLKSKSPKQDDALREEIAVIASNMVALTALKEGSRSPILSLLPSSPEDGGRTERKSLADRASDLLSDQPPT
jgi:hypothetical protein